MTLDLHKCDPKLLCKHPTCYTVEVSTSMFLRAHCSEMVCTFDTIAPMVRNYSRLQSHLSASLEF